LGDPSSEVIFTIPDPAAAFVKATEFDGALVDDAAKVLDLTTGLTARR
jgi:hypothetical protein